MVQFTRIASELRLGAFLCSSAAVLLAGCGGAADPDSSATTQSPQFAPYTQAAEAAPAPLQASVTPSAEAPNFDLTGYGADPMAPDANSAEGAEPAVASGAAAPSGAPEAQGGTRLLATVTTSVARNYYVATNGSDSNPGTQAQPFRTIARASKAAVPNTNIFVAPGSYSGSFQTTVSGNASGRIYYVSTKKWGAKIVPPANSSSDFAWDNRGSHVQIIGFEIDGSAHKSGKKWTRGIYNGGSYGTIKENHVHHIATNAPCNSNGGSAIGADSYYKGVQIDVIGNSVHDIGPAGCHFVQGIYISTSGSVKNNLVYRVAEAAIHLWHDANNVVITNNTVVASNTGIIVGGGDFYNSSAGADRVSVHSNIVYDNVYGISEQGKTGRSNTYRNNLVYQNKYNWTLKNGLTHSGTVSSAPYFNSYSKSAATPNLRLTSSSPAIGRGTAAGAHPTDIDGKPRNNSTGFDIGAYQH
jgi:hypothetical protein